MKWAFSCAILMVLATLPARAIDTAMLRGKGATTCALFDQDYKKNVAIEAEYYTWAQGYMSGLNAIAHAVLHPTKDLAASSYQTQEAAIRDYCATNPLDDYTTAVTHIWTSFPTVPYQKNDRP